MSWNVMSYKATLIGLKSLSTLALKQLENVEGEKLPEDPELRNNLFSLFSALHDVWERVEDEYPSLCRTYSTLEEVQDEEVQDKDQSRKE